MSDSSVALVLGAVAMLCISSSGAGIIAWRSNLLCSVSNNLCVSSTAPLPVSSTDEIKTNLSSGAPPECATQIQAYAGWLHDHGAYLASDCPTGMSAITSNICMPSDFTGVYSNYNSYNSCVHPTPPAPPGPPAPPAPPAPPGPPGPSGPSGGCPATCPTGSSCTSGATTCTAQTGYTCTGTPITSCAINVGQTCSVGSTACVTDAICSLGKCVKNNPVQGDICTTETSSRCPAGTSCIGSGSGIFTCASTTAATATYQVNTPCSVSGVTTDPCGGNMYCAVTGTSKSGQCQNQVQVTGLGGQSCTANGNYGILDPCLSSTTDTYTCQSGQCQKFSLL